MDNNNNSTTFHRVLRWMACGCITIEPKLRIIKVYKQLPFLISSLAKISSNEKSGIAI
jgi:hypothetical protein